MNKLIIFKKIIYLLVKIQLIRQRKIKDFKRKNYKIPTYHSKIILDEAKLFSDWYLKRALRASRMNRPRTLLPIYERPSTTPLISMARPGY